jgi:hypothetical protein
MSFITLLQLWWRESIKFVFIELFIEWTVSYLKYDTIRYASSSVLCITAIYYRAIVYESSSGYVRDVLFTLGENTIFSRKSIKPRKLLSFKQINMVDLKPKQVFTKMSTIESKS